MWGGRGPTAIVRKMRITDTGGEVGKSPSSTAQNQSFWTLVSQWRRMKSWCCICWEARVSSFLPNTGPTTSLTLHFPFYGLELCYVSVMHFYLVRLFCEINFMMAKILVILLEIERLVFLYL